MVALAGGTFTKDATAGIQFRILKSIVNELKTDILTNHPVLFNYKPDIEPRYEENIDFYFLTDTLTIYNFKYDDVKFDL